MNYKEQIEKIAFEMTSEFLSKEAAAPSRDDDLNTRMWRDRVKPELQRAMLSAPSMLPGMVLAGRGRAKGDLRQIMDGNAVSTYGVIGANAYSRYADMNKLSEKYLGHKANMKDFLSLLVTTPEARIQQLRRQQAQQNK